MMQCIFKQSWILNHDMAGHSIVGLKFQQRRMEYHDDRFKVKNVLTDL